MNNYNRICPDCMSRYIFGNLDGWIDVIKCTSCQDAYDKARREHQKKPRYARGGRRT